MLRVRNILRVHLCIVHDTFRRLLIKILLIIVIHVDVKIFIVRIKPIEETFKRSLA